VKGPIDSWKAVFDEKYSGQILMLDDMRECFAVALKSMGKSLNTTDPQTLRQAADLLKAQKKLVKTYNSNDYDNILKSGDVILAHGYNGQIAKLALAEPGKFAYVIPKEGATVSMDGLCIPAAAKHVEEALEFINFIHEPEINAEVVNHVNYASTNEAARKLIRPEILNNPWIYPPRAALANCEFMEDPGPAMELLDQLWTEIKAE
jgi:spermidine/putrescine-binding protein